MIDKTALREALINEIVHNDYTKEVPPVVEIYSDRLSITSYGGLIEGLSEEEFFKGRSMPRNRELMRIFSDLDFVEQLGSGMHRILNSYDKNIFKISENFLEICFPFSQDYLDTIQDKGHETGQVTGQVNQLLLVCESAKSKSELMELLQLKGRDNFERLYLKPALSLKLLEMTIPEKPKSRNQKYRLTEKGKQYKKQLNIK